MSLKNRGLQYGDDDDDPKMFEKTSKISFLLFSIRSKSK